MRDAAGRMLVGWRRNRPARDTWFVPGGRIVKGESLDAAFARITHVELGRSLARAGARFAGAYDHVYPDNALGAPGFGTHYVVLAHVIAREPGDLALPTNQHSDYLWLDDDALRTRVDVHANTRAYAGLRP